MSRLDQFRARPSPPRPRNGTWLLLIAGVAVGFGLGYAALLAWPRLPTQEQLTGLFRSHVAVALPGFSGSRIGRAGTAPLLQSCFTTEIMDMPSDDIAPKVLYQIMHAANIQERGQAMLGASPAFKNLSGVRSYGAVAQCIFSQPRLTLCDIDNRALAVEVTSMFLWAAEGAEAAPPRDQQWNSDLSEIVRMRDRVVAGLAFVAREGVLTVSDFGSFAPAAALKAIAPARPVRNACEQA